MIKRNKKVIAALLAVSATAAIFPTGAMAAVTATATATVTSQYPTMNISGLGEVQYFTGADIWGNSEYKSIDVSYESDKHQSGTRSYDYYCVLAAIPGKTVKFSRSVSNGDSMSLYFDGQTQRFADNITNAGASISFVMRRYHSAGCIKCKGSILYSKV